MILHSKDGSHCGAAAWNVFCVAAFVWERFSTRTSSVFFSSVKSAFFMCSCPVSHGMRDDNRSCVRVGRPCLLVMLCVDYVRVTVPGGEGLTQEGMLMSNAVPVYSVPGIYFCILVCCSLASMRRSSFGVTAPKTCFIQMDAADRDLASQPISGTPSSSYGFWRFDQSVYEWVNIFRFVVLSSVALS